MFGWFRKKPAWEEAYSQRIYDGLVADDHLGDMTPAKLRVPIASYRRYHDKALLHRELAGNVPFNGYDSPAPQYGLNSENPDYNSYYPYSGRDYGNNQYYENSQYYGSYLGGLGGLIGPLLGIPIQ